MSKIRQILRNSIIINLFFILTGFYLVRAQSSFYVPTDHCCDPIQTKIELVVSIGPENEISFFELDTPPKQIPDFTHTHNGLLTTYKFALYDYNNYVQHQLNSFERIFDPSHQLISILQKHNIWHQSSDEDADFSVKSAHNKFHFL
jgi:hypothetical protein